ncbi:tRNA (adenosine(37)-N6)-threonylcarbamoyltransferase complex transferase subunit TsaD [Patescibacteria group bacterium]|nr:tRNA (adenosine(37)-N6)-threonylcarbamoyltransferase complex transferase subunit TsaD [Patescibacteria group bacterium]
MKILGIETSCDETAASVVEDGTKELAFVVASSKDFHEKTGGVVPEVAARKQVEYIVPVLDQVFSQVPKEQIDAIAVTQGPGLIGSLIVGIEAAKALSLALNKPLIAVNHLVAHFYANFLTYSPKEIKFPALVLVVSGGHTDLVLMLGHGNLQHLGSTIDDAAGEAFDKTARILGIGDYLGGVKLSNKAAECKENTLAGLLPRPMLDKDTYDFSFSGLKTAAKRIVEEAEIGDSADLRKNYSVEALACEFETAVVDVLVGKTVRAACAFNVKSLLIGGGVAANTLLRTRLQNDVANLGIQLFLPELRLCGDNASTVASAGYFNQRFVSFSELTPKPSLTIIDTC